jgi:ABC-type transport system substrate-binding protein
MSTSLVAMRRAAAPLVLCAALAPLGCSPPPPAATHAYWVMGGAEPEFDPAGPPDARRWALERLLTRGLVEPDTAGVAQPAAAESVSASADSLTWTFRLRAGLAFTDGSSCTSEDFARALREGLERADHQTVAWALAALDGVDAIRPGRPLPELGIATPDARTLVLRLDRPDVLFLRKLAIPGVTAVWKAGTPRTWQGAVGLGPYRALDTEAGRRLRLLRRAAENEAAPPWAEAALETRAWELGDTLTVRFGFTAGRARSQMRDGIPDLIWPLPLELLDEPLPEAYRSVTAPARPRRVLELVLRADLPPTSRASARRALAHGLNREDLLRRLGAGFVRHARWVAGGVPAELPALDGDQVRLWMERAKLGRSFHVDLAYRGDGPGAAIVRALQGEWARHAIYVEPKALRGARYRQAALTGRDHLLLAEAPALLDDAGGELAARVMPVRGPAVGGYRTGWRTREFDRWTGPRPADLESPLAFFERRLAEELVTLPLAELDWLWVERSSRPGTPVHPRFGPVPLLPAPAPKR